MKNYTIIAYQQKLAKKNNEKIIKSMNQQLY